MKRKIRFLIYSLFFIFISFSLRGQEETKKSLKADLKVRGIVMNKGTLQPVSYATLSIYCHTSNQTIDTLRQVVDDGGRFEVALPRAERYSFEAQFVGLKSIPIDFTKEALQKKGLIRVTMEQDDTLLDEVVLVAKKPIVRLGIDRIAYNVKDDPMNKSLSLHEMMRRVPLVTIDGEGNLQVKGSSNYALYLNNRPSKFISSNPKEVLKSIPASSVKNIEVITNPGVEYDATGASVIINIITDQGIDLKGVMGTVSLASLFHNGFSASGNLSVAFGKASLTASYNGLDYWQSKKYSNYIKTATENPIAYRTSEIINNELKYRTHNFNLAFNYELNRNNILSSNFTFGRQGHTPTLLETTTLAYNSKKLMQLLSQEKLSTWKKMYNNSYEWHTDYQHNFQREGEQIVLSYLFVHNPQYSLDSIDYNFFKDNKSVYTQEVLSSNRNLFDEHTGQADYIIPFSEKHKLTAGAKYIFRRGSSLPHFTNLKEENSAPKGIGVTRNNEMSYTQQILATYLKYALSLDKISATAGARLEWGKQKVNYPPKKYDNPFLDVVPEVGFSYNASPLFQLKTNYNMYVRRPSISQLSPFQNILSAEIAQRGNSNLKNEYNHTLSLSISSYGSKLTLQGGVDASYVKSPIASITLVDPDDTKKLIATYENIGYSRGAGANIFLRYAPVDWFFVMTNASAHYDEYDAGITKNHFDGSDYHQYNKGWSTQGMLMCNFQLPKSWTLVAYGGVFSQPLTLSSNVFYGSYHGLSISKSFLEGKLNLSGNINNPFLKYYKFNVVNKGAGFRTDTYVERRALNLTLSVSYTFGELKSSIQKVSKTIKNNDISTTKNDSAMGGGDNK